MQIFTIVINWQHNIWKVI